MLNEHDIKDMREISQIPPGSVVDYKRADGVTTTYMFDKIVGNYAHLYPVGNFSINPVYCDLQAKFYVR